MATVMVTIDGKTYRMACEEGQEAHLIELARRFDLYVSHLKSSFGEIGDHRLSVMAGIMVLDEMDALEARLAIFERDNETLAQEKETMARQIEKREQNLAHVIENMAKRIERMGQRLNNRDGIPTDSRL